MMADASLRACLALPGCTSLTCPDAAPYAAPHPRLPRTGAVCQARSVASGAAWRGGEGLEANHGMCAPGGCTSFFLARLAPEDLPEELARQLSAALHSRGLQHQEVLLAWGGAGEAGVGAAARQLLAAPSLPELAVLQQQPARVEAAGWPWLLRSSSAAPLAEALGHSAAALPWATLGSTLSVYLY